MWERLGLGRMKNLQPFLERKMTRERFCWDEIENLPQIQMVAMEEQNAFDSIPKAEDICFEGLMMLSAVMVD